MTAVSIRKEYRSRLDSSDVVSVTKVLKLHILERKLNFGEYGTRGNMGDFPISSGGGQFTFVPLSLWYKFATRGCRWICYSNCQSNPSKAQNIFETLFALDWRMQIMFQICFRLFLGGEILAQRPHVGGGIFHTEFIQICTIFGVDFDKKHHIHQIL